MDTTEHQGHESSDANIRGVVLAAVGLALTALLVHVALYFQLHLLATRADRAEPVAPAFAPTREHGPPPEPRLQTAPADDLRQMRAAEEKQLTTYGWVDREAGIVHVPIERAKELIAEGGR